MSPTLRSGLEEMLEDPCDYPLQNLLKLLAHVAVWGYLPEKQTNSPTSLSVWQTVPEKKQQNEVTISDTTTQCCSEDSSDIASVIDFTSVQSGGSAGGDGEQQKRPSYAVPWVCRMRVQ